MFPSNSNNNSSGAYNLAINSTQSPNNNQLSHFVPSNQNPNYSFFNFPPHNLLYHDDIFLDTILPYQSPQPLPPPPPPPPLPSQPPPTTIETQNVESFEDPKKKEKEKGKRKRVVVRKAGKKDRHSKIHTAHGPRDRRMRLSLQIARKFFDLQDMLGFDKASKTIEWLFNKSKAAIKDLAEKSCTNMLPSSPSLDGYNNGDGDGDNDGDINHDKSKEQRKSKSGLFQKKVNREKARARARERTKEKLIMMQKQGTSVLTTTNNNSNNPSCSENNNMEVIIRSNDNNRQVNEYGFAHNHHQLQQQPLEEQMASVGIIEKFLTTSSSSSIFDFGHNGGNQDRGLGRSIVPCDSMMVRSNNVVGFDDFPASWVSENARINASGFPTVTSNMGSSSANGPFMGRPFN